MEIRPLALAAALLGAGCTHLSLETAYAPAAELKFDAAQYPDDSAALLYAEDGMLIANRQSEDSYSQQLTHRVYAVLNEKAFELAEVRVALYGKNKLIALKARHVKPDGTTQEIGPNDIISDQTTAKDSDKAVNGKLFRFPDVQIGSVLEWVYVVEEPFIDTDNESERFGEYPVRHYEAWIEASKEIILESRFYNVPAQAHAGPGRNEKFLRISTSARDIPASPKREAYAADWTFSQPRWAYRMLRWNFGGRRTPVLETWNDVIGRWARRAWSTDKDSLGEGFTERVDVSGCAEVRCKIDRVRSLVHSRTEYSGVGSWRAVRKLTEVLESHEASAFERALLMRRLLEDAGVRASLAAYTTRHSEQTDKGFPTVERFNRVLVYVAEGQPTWLDPSCEACAPGTVSDEARGVEALVFHARILPVGEPFIESEERIVLTQVLPDPTRVVSTVATLAANGDAALEVREEQSGRWAFDRCAKLRTKGERRRADESRDDALQLAPTARLLSTAVPECQPAAARCVEGRKVMLPGHAVAQGDRLLVPLTLLDPDWSETFSEEKRLQPIAFEGGDRRTEYRLKLEAPPGYQLAQAPKPEQAAAPGMTAQLEVKPTASGADVTLSVAISAGYHEATNYAAYRAVGEFLRNARTRVIELKKK